MNEELFQIYFNLMKIRYNKYDESLMASGFLNPTDKVNVFINIEGVLKYLSMVRDLEKKLIVCKRQFPDVFKVELLNIAAHYKEFFVGNHLDTKVFLYMTDLSSSIDKFKETKFMEDFRTYYLVKYTQNPKFILMGETWMNEIAPDVKILCDYIPNVYFIQSKNVDGGLIPYIIGKKFPDRKNLIVSADLHDTQYSDEEGFLDHYYAKTYGKSLFGCNTREYLQFIAKNGEVSDDFVELFSNPSFYRILLSCMGDKYRSIPDIRGIKFAKMTKILWDAIKTEQITKETSNATLLSELFPDNVKEEIKNNFIVTDIKNEYSLLTDGDVRDILSQIVDQSDINTLQQLNRTRFKRHQLRLESLLK